MADRPEGGAGTHDGVVWLPTPESACIYVGILTLITLGGAGWNAGVGRKRCRQLITSGSVGRTREYLLQPALLFFGCDRPGQVPVVLSGPEDGCP